MISSVCTLTAVCFIFLVTILCCCVDILLFGHMEGRDEQHSVCQSKYLMKYTCGPNACHNTWSYRLSAAKHTHFLCPCVCVCVQPPAKSMPCLCVCFYIESESKSACLSFGSFSGSNSCGWNTTTSYSAELSKAPLMYKLSSWCEKQHRVS